MVCEPRLKGKGWLVGWRGYRTPGSAPAPVGVGLARVALADRNRSTRCPRRRACRSLPLNPLRSYFLSGRNFAVAVLRCDLRNQVCEGQRGFGLFDLDGSVRDRNGKLFAFLHSGRLHDTFWQAYRKAVAPAHELGMGRHAVSIYVCRYVVKPNACGLKPG